MDWAVAHRAATSGALGLPAQGFGSLLLDRAGNPLVYIFVARIDQSMLAALAGAGAQVVHVSGQFGVVTAAVPPGQLATMAALPGVASMQEALAPGVREHGVSERSLGVALPARQAAGSLPNRRCK